MEKQMKRILACVCTVLMFAQYALAQEITLPKSLLTIGEQAFEGSAAFENVVLSDGVTAIESRAFAQCLGLRAIEIPESVTQIADDAFEGCDGLLIRCAEGSYAQQYAADHGMEVEITDGGVPDRITVSIAAGQTMIEAGQAGCEWTVTVSYTMEGDWLELCAYMNGEVCFEEQTEVENWQDHAPQSFDFGWTHESGMPGECYAVVSYHHADGSTTQAISTKTQIVGALSASLEAADPNARTGETIGWTLHMQQAAGSAVAQYSLYQDGELIEQSGYMTGAEYRVKAETAGIYTAQAEVIDGLGREITVLGEAITVSEEQATEDPLTYQLSADGAYYIVTGCDEGADSAAIPAQRNGLPVSEISGGAFMACEKLTSVSLPETIVRVGAYAFHGCEQLVSVTIHNEDVQMGEGVFSGCTALRSIPLPAGMKEIPDYYAQGCAGPETLVLPDGMASVGREAFAACAGIGTVQMPDSLTDIGSGAFSGCSGLSAVQFGAGLTELGEGAFSGCSALRELEVPDSLTAIGAEAFARCTGLKDIALPQSIEQIGDSAFSGCENLETVLIGNPDASVGKYAFDYCPDLEIQTEGAGSIESQVREMGYAFRNIALTVLTQAELLTSMPAAGREMLWHAQAEWGTAPYAYRFEVYCDGELQAVRESGTEAYFRCTAQKAGQYYAVITAADALGVSAQRTSAPYDVKPSEPDTLDYLTYELAGDGTAYAITGFVNLPADGAQVVIPGEIDGIPVTKIAAKAARLNTLITELTIPDSVTLIDNDAFYGCTALKSVTIGSGLTGMGERAFYNCEALESINLPYGLEIIGAQALYKCISLRDFVIPSSVASIGDEAFYGCRTLAEMTVPSSVSLCGEGIFYGCSQLKSAVWNASVSELPAYSFYGCANLEEVSFGYPVEALGNSAFYQCSALEDVLGKLGSIESIGEYTFYQCTALEAMRLPAKAERIFFGEGAFEGCTALSELTLDKETILKPYGNAFYGCTALWNITCKYISLYAPNNGAYLGEACFANCTSLRTVTIEGSLDKRVFENCTGLSKVTFLGTQVIGQYALRNCTSLSAVDFPDMRENSDDERHKFIVDPGAFQNCTSLQTVVFPQDPYGFTIGDYAFENCTGLTRVGLPTTRSNRHIREGAFRNCTELTTVSHLMSMMTVGKEAFKNCAKLSNIQFSPVPQEGTLPNQFAIGEEAFAGCRSLGHLSFDEYTVEIGDNAFADCGNLTVSTEPDSYAESYFASGDYGTATASSMITEISAEVEWGSVDDETNTVDAVITVYNTQNGPVPTGVNALETMENSAIQSAVITLQRSSKTYHDVWLVDSGEIGEIPYRGSVSVRAKVRCKSTPAAACDHGMLTVNVAADGEQYTLNAPIAAGFHSRIQGDWYITEPTDITANTVVGGNVYVQSMLSIRNASLHADGGVYVQQGASVRMTQRGMLSAALAHIQAGGELVMDGASVRVDELKDEGVLSMLTAASRVQAERFSVNGSGILNMAADGEISTDVFTFDTTASHASLLTDGMITAREAVLTQGFHASEKQAFAVTGGVCMLDVKRTTPLQRFASLVIDCEPGDLTVENISLLGKLPFECAHFGMTSNSMSGEAEKSNEVAKEIHDKFMAARMEQMAEAEAELAEALEDWYSVSLVLGSYDTDTLSAAKKATTFAERAVLRWALETAAQAPDKWTRVNDVLNSILAAGTGGCYTFEEGGRKYELDVRPIGGLSISSASLSAGRITCKVGADTFEYTFALNQDGIRKGGEALLEVLRKYGEEEYVKYLNKAVEEAFGKENVKYALAVVKVVETSLIEEKTIFEVIADKYGKSIAKKLVYELFPEVKKTVDFINKWDKYLKQTDKIKTTIQAVRSGEELPTDLMAEFLKLEKLVP